MSGVTHSHVSAIADDPTKDVSSGEWNDAHVIADGSFAAAKVAFAATDKLLGRATAGAGNGEEIALTAAGRAILDDATPAAQRATLGAASWHGAWSAATAYVPGDMVTIDGASWVCVLANTALRPFPANYREAMLITVPVSYWRLGEASGVTAVDEMNAAFNGTYHGSLTLGATGLLTGDPNTAMLITATDQRLNLPDAVKPSGSFTYAIWVNEATGGSSAGNLIGVDYGTNRCWMSTYRAGGVLALFTSAGTPAQIDGGVIPANGTPYFAVATHDGTYGRLYLDGLLVAGPTVMDAPTTFTSGMYCGGGYNELLGTIDEPATWSRGVTPAEIAGLNAVGTGTVVWERITPPAAYLDPATATAGDIATALIAAGLMAAA